MYSIVSQSNKIWQKALNIRQSCDFFKTNARNTKRNDNKKDKSYGRERYPEEEYTLDRLQKSRREGPWSGWTRINELDKVHSVDSNCETKMIIFVRKWWVVTGNSRWRSEPYM